MKLSLFSKAVVSFSLVLGAASANATDLIASTVAIYQSTTWDKPYTYAVVRQPGHAALYYCITGNNFSGDASNAAQILNFYKTNCLSELNPGIDSHANYTGFDAKTYVPVGANPPKRLIVTSSYSNSVNLAAYSSGFQTYAIDLDISANPASSTIEEQGVQIKFKDTDNPVMQSYKQTFRFIGMANLDFPKILN